MQAIGMARLRGRAYGLDVVGAVDGGVPVFCCPSVAVMDGVSSPTVMSLLYGERGTALDGVVCGVLPSKCVFRRVCSATEHNNKVR